MYSAAAFSKYSCFSLSSPFTIAAIASYCTALIYPSRLLLALTFPMIINCSAVDISSEAYTRNSAEVCGFVACSFASSLRLSYTPGSISFSSEGVGRWYSPSLIAFRFISISSCFSVECRLGATLSTPHTPSPPPRPIVLPEFTSTSSSGRLLKERFSYESLAVALAYAVSLHVLLEGAGVGAQRGSDLGVGYSESHTSPPTLNARLHKLAHGRTVSQTPTHLRLTLSSRGYSILLHVVVQRSDGGGEGLAHVRVCSSRSFSWLTQQTALLHFGELGTVVEFAVDDVLLHVLLQLLHATLQNARFTTASKNAAFLQLRRCAATVEFAVQLA